MPKLELWKLSPELVKFDYLTSHTQKSPDQLKKSTKHENKKTSVSPISNFQKPNTSRTLNTGQKTKVFKTIRGSSRWQTVKRANHVIVHLLLI